MNRKIYLAAFAMLAAIALLYFPNPIGEHVYDSVLNVTGEKEVVEVSETAAEEEDETVWQDDLVVIGGVLPIDRGVVAVWNHLFDIRESLDLSKQKVERVVLLTDNPRWFGKDPISISSKSFYRQLRKTILSDGFNSNINYGPSEEAFSVQNNADLVMEVFEDYFPEAEIETILLKDFVDEEDLDDLAELLFLNAENTVVFSLAKFSEGLDKTVAQFQGELNRNIYSFDDEEAIEKMVIDSRPVVRIMMKYLSFWRARADDINADISGNSVIYRRGELSDFEELEDERDLTILAFGDLMLGRHVRVLTDTYGEDYVFENIRGPKGSFFGGADVVFANLEGAISGEGRVGGTANIFQFHENVAPFLAKAGFNVLSIANNHALDAGWEGRASTMEALTDAGVGFCGHPTEVDKASVYYGKVGGDGDWDKINFDDEDEINYAFVCFQDINYEELDLARAQMWLEFLDKRVDYLVVSVHWGPEYFHQAHQRLEVDLGHMFVDAGADLVLGHHPHVVQNLEVYKDRLILYSLGNFVFDQYWSQKTQEGLAVGVVLDKEGEEIGTRLYLMPMKSEMSQPRLMTEAEKEKWFLKFLSYGDYGLEMAAMIKKGVVEI